jgi:hypothetical protein
MSKKPLIPSEDLVSIRENLPRLWWNIYQGSLQTGFDKEQSMWLLGMYILSSSPNGVTIRHITQGPDSDNPGA